MRSKMRFHLDSKTKLHPEPSGLSLRELNYFLLIGVIFLTIFFLSILTATALAQKEEDKITTSNSKPFSYYQSISKRNLFKPLWIKSTDKPKLEKRKAEIEEKKLKAEIRRLKAGLKLSGIVFNGKCYLAIIEDRRKKGSSSFYKEGDIIREAKIVSIKEDKLEVVLNFKGEEIILALMPKSEKTEKSPSSSLEGKIQKTSPTFSEAKKNTLPPEDAAYKKARKAKRKKMIQKLLPLRGYLGIDVQEITSGLVKKLDLPFEKGLYVVRVQSNTQAYKKGLRRGDLILEINGKKVKNLKNVQQVFEKANPNKNKEVSLTIVKERSHTEQSLIIEFMDEGVD